MRQGHDIGRRLFGGIALTLLGSLLAMLVGEAVLRVFLKDDIIITPRYHSDVQYNDYTIRRLRPNTVFWHTTVDGSWKFVTNAQGFRNETDFSYAKPAGTIRVLSLGDSHTQGSEVRQDHTFSAVIERYLRGEGVDAQVINAGVAGFSTAEALVCLENEGVKYQPDVVVLGFYGNDLIDNIKAGIFVLTDEGLVVKKKKHIPGVRILNVINQFGVLRWLSENSYLYSFAFNSVWIYAKRLLSGRAKAELTTEYAIPVDEVDDYQTRLSAELIKRMAAFCKKNGIKLVILDIPRVAENNGQVKSSVPIELLDVMQTNSDRFVYSVTALHDYRNVAQLHVPNGHRHISEFTHMVYGLDVGRWIVRVRGVRENSWCNRI